MWDRPGLSWQTDAMYVAIQAECSAEVNKKGARSRPSQIAKQPSAAWPLPKNRDGFAVKNPVETDAMLSGEPLNDARPWGLAGLIAAVIPKLLNAVLAVIVLLEQRIQLGVQAVRRRVSSRTMFRSSAPMRISPFSNISSWRASMARCAFQDLISMRIWFTKT